MAMRSFLGLGAVLVVYSLIVTGCTRIADTDGTLRIKEIDSPAAGDISRLNEARRLWVEESGENGDPFTAGKAAWDIAQLTRDAKWSNEAIDYLDRAKAEMPQFALATAYLGSAHALAARDYPFRGAWQLLPGPGFVRIYHVERAKSFLNEAVDQDSDNPVIRLIRAATVINMPGLLADHDMALDDFELMAQWEANPEKNPAYGDVLRSPEWRNDFYKAWSEVLLERGDATRAAVYEQKRNSATGVAG